MLDKFQQLGCSMALKVHSLPSHLDNFLEYLGSSMMNKGKCFTRRKLRRVIKENEMSTR
jgi:hypothetical protein